MESKSNVKPCFFKSRELINAVVFRIFVALLLSVLVLDLPSLAWAENSSPMPGHYLFVDKDGQLWGWGDNAFGQLGREGLSAARLPLPLDFPAPILSAATGKRHSVVVDNRGSVWVWGDNSAGQLGTGDFNNSVKPMRLELPAVAAVGAGAWHTVALDKSGHVWTWGGNTLGQLGSGKSGKFSVATAPQKVGGLDNVVAIRSGDYHVLALCADGSVWAWGKNQQGQLGNGDRTPHDRPSRVAGLPKIHLINAAGNASQALGIDGKAWGWGKYSDTDQGSTAPHQIGGVLPAEGVAAFRVSGRVMANDHPVAGATVSVDDEACATTDNHGAYLCLLPAGFKGVLQAQKDGFIFAEVKIKPISKPLSDRNILGSANAVRPKLELALGLKANQEHVVSTSPVASIPLDSSERVREKEEIRMPPIVATVSESHSKATAEDEPVPKKQETQVVTIRIGGTVHMSGKDSKGLPVSDVEISGKGAQCGPSDGRGEYLCSVQVGWTGHLVAAKRSYKFSPKTISFRDVREDRSYQDFTAFYEPD